MVMRAVAVRIADVLKVPAWHDVRARARCKEVRRHQVWRNPPFDAQGRPVLVIGGMGSTPALLDPLCEVLRRLNFRCVVAPVRLGLDCGETMLGQVEDVLAWVVKQDRCRAIVIGHSRGGQIAKALAVRRPDLVDSLITLGSPLTRMLGVRPWLMVHIALVALAGLLGAPGLFRPSCAWGECCSRFRADLVGQFPGGVPFTSVYSRADRVVDWRTCLDPAARSVEVRTSHGCLIWAPAAILALVVELARLIDRSADPLASAA